MLCYNTYTIYIYIYICIYYNITYHNLVTAGPCIYRGRTIARQK